MLVVKPVARIGESKVALEAADSPCDPVEVGRNREHRIKVPNRLQNVAGRSYLERVGVGPLLDRQDGSRAKHRTARIRVDGGIRVRGVCSLMNGIEKTERVPDDRVRSGGGVPSANARS